MIAFLKIKNNSHYIINRIKGIIIKTLLKYKIKMIKIIIKTKNNISKIYTIKNKNQKEKKEKNKQWINIKKDYNHKNK